MTKIQLV